MKPILITTCLALTLVEGTASADWTKWVGNDHSYQAISVPGGITWASAQAQAQSLGGNLVTISSPAENAFVYNLFASNTAYWSVATDTWGPWIGGLQPVGSPEPSGGWTWVTGEAFAYSAWEPFEPNNYGGVENRIHFYGRGANNFASTWNDADGTLLMPSFVVEVVPEPGSGALLAAAVAGFVLRRRFAR